MECPSCGNKDRFLAWQKHWRRMAVSFKGREIKDVTNTVESDDPVEDAPLVAWTCEDCGESIESEVPEEEVVGEWGE